MDFNNMTNISIPASDLWRPDVVLFNKLVVFVFLLFRFAHATHIFASKRIDSFLDMFLLHAEATDRDRLNSILLVLQPRTKINAEGVNKPMFF